MLILTSSGQWCVQETCPVLQPLTSLLNPVFSQMWMSVPWGLMTATQMLFVKTPRSCTSACAKWVTLAKGRNVKVKWLKHYALPVSARGISEKMQPLKNNGLEHGGWFLNQNSHCFLTWFFFLFTKSEANRLHGFSPSNVTWSSNWFVV